MPAARMFIVAGPPGGGKSSIFSLSDFAERVFNADDRAAELNAGSYQSIPLTVRAEVNREFERFVHANISAGTSFALETTLRSGITFEQARFAAAKGFRVVMRYIALDTVEGHIDRIRRRAARGGHSASESTLRRIYERSLANLPFALDPGSSGIDSLRVYDNSQFETRPALLLETRNGTILHLADSFPLWLQRTLGWTTEDLQRRRNAIPNSATWKNI